MARYQNGSVRIEQRKDGPTWVYRFQVTRSDGKRVEHTSALGLVKDIGTKEKDAWDGVDRQHLRETVNHLQPFKGTPRTYGQLCQHYMENELMEDQCEATIDKIRRVMNLVYLHGQRCNFLPRQQEGNPMNWVRQRTTSSYQALIMTPQQAFEILLNIPEPRRTLALSDAATALRVSEILGLMWMDLNFDDLVMYVRRAYVWGRFKEPKSRASKAPVPMHPLLAGFLLAWREKTPYARDNDFVFPSTRLKGKKPLSASILVQKYLRPAAVKAGVIEEGQKVRFGFHNFRHSLASALVRMKVDPKTVQEFLRQANITTTLQLYTQSDMESKRDAQGRFLEQLLGGKAHLLTERIQ